MAKQIINLQFSSDGSPFAKIAAPPTNPDTLEFSLDGSPWWGHGGEGAPPEPVGFMMYVGELQVQKVYLGATEISPVLLGSIQF